MHSGITCVAIAYLAFVIGCAPSAPTHPASATTASGHAHGDHDHDHGDHDHDHGDHDHDHGDHDHDHDHGDHDHGDHDHDHGDHTSPKTVAEGIAQLEKLCADARAHLAAGDHGKADEPVHMVGHLLEDLDALVTKEKPSAKAEARKALDAVFECFDKIDTAIHAADDEARKTLDYAEHAPAIEAAVAKLKELMQ